MADLEPAPPAIVLVGAQMGENIGAAARVMANFGLADLRLVAPRDGWPNAKAASMAAGALRVAVRVSVFADSASAISGLSQVLAVSARKRDMQKPVLGPREGCAAVRANAMTGTAAGLMFGPEASGLSNADVSLCDGLVTLPVTASFSSLNLAQAVAVLAYEWGASAHNAPAPPSALEPPASKAAQLGLFAHLEQALERAGFFFPPEKKPLMVQNIRNALTRAQLTEQEVRTFRGIVRALEHGRGAQGKCQ